MSELQTEMWGNAIDKMIRKHDIDGLEKYKKVIENTAGIDNTIKATYIQKCEDAKSSAKKVNASGVIVGKKARHKKLSRKQLTALIIGGAALAAVSGMAGAAIHGHFSPKNPTQQEMTNDGDDKNNDNNKDVIINTIKPTLSFDTEDTEVMIQNLKDFVKGVLPNGIELTDAELEEEVESLVNYYVWMNLNEVGPTYLSELYQTDSISYIEIFSDAMYWANVLRFDSMTSSAKDNTVVDLSNVISNKKDLELVQSFQNLNARLHDAVDANDVASIKNIVSEYKTLVETKLLDHVSYSYGQGAMDLCFRLVYSGEQLLADYKMVIMDDSLAKIINEDTFLKCIQSISISTIEDKTYTKEEIEQVIQTNTSKKSDNVIYQIDLLKDYMLRLNMQLDFTGKKSLADVMTEVPAYIRDNNLLSTYKANESLEEFFARIYEQTHPKKNPVKPGDVVIDDDKYIPKEELDKENISTEGKTPEQIEEEYQESIKDKVEDSLEDDKTFTDNDGNVLESGSDAETYAVDFAKGYTEGSKKGAIDGNALAPEKSVVTGSKGYVDGYAKGYKEAYAEQNKIV